MITMIRGDSRTIRGTLKHPVTNLALDISGFVIWFTVKRRYRDLDASAIIRKSTDGAIGGIIVPDATNGTFFVSILPENTNTLESKDLIELIYDVQIITAAGLIQTVARGKFVVKGEITQAIA